MRRGREEWIRIGRRRIIRILAQRKVCSIHQLECKISESGPGDQRVQPLPLSKSIEGLISDKIITPYKPMGLPKHAPRLYVFADFDSAKNAPFVTTTLDLHQKHEELRSIPELCSDVLEEMAKMAADMAGKFSEVTRNKKNAPLDIEAKYKGILLGIDCKNRREWMYPHHPELWNIIKKCMDRNAVPVVITRKIPYVGYLVFKKIGVFGFQTHRQYFSPKAKASLTDIQHKDKLGFKDVVVMETPTKEMIKWFSKTVPENIQKYQKTFESSRTLLQRYAIEKDLARRNHNDTIRMQTYKEFVKELFHGDTEEEAEVIALY